jgi:hypothetical protein
LQTVARGTVIVRRTTAVLHTIVKRPVAAEAATDFVADKIDVFEAAGGGVEVCIEIISVFDDWVISQSLSILNLLEDMVIKVIVLIKKITLFIIYYLLFIIYYLLFIKIIY